MQVQDKILFFIASGGLGILCYFLKGILEEMKKLNDKLLVVVANQEWHYKAIIDLQSRMIKMEARKEVINEKSI